jgi:hypothetical protein
MPALVAGIHVFIGASPNKTCFYGRVPSQEHVMAAAGRAEAPREGEARRWLHASARSIGYERFPNRQTSLACRQEVSGLKS